MSLQQPQQRRNSIPPLNLKGTIYPRHILTKHFCLVSQCLKLANILSLALHLDLSEVPYCAHPDVGSKFWTRASVFRGEKRSSLLQKCLNETKKSLKVFFFKSEKNISSILKAPQHSAGRHSAE